MPDPMTDYAADKFTAIGKAFGFPALLLLIFVIAAYSILKPYTENWMRIEELMAQHRIKTEEARLEMEQRHMELLIEIHSRQAAILEKIGESVEELSKQNQDK